jgi:hypothetical protein
MIHLQRYPRPSEPHSSQKPLLAMGFDEDNSEFYVSEPVDLDDGIGCLFTFAALTNFTNSSFCWICRAAKMR